MAGLPGRRTGFELIGLRAGRAPLPLLSTVLALAGLLGAGWGSGVAAQAGGAPDAEVPSPPLGFVQGGLTGTRLGEQPALFFTAGAGIRFRSGLRAWGEGRTLIRDVEPAGDRPLRLRFGYGGVGVEWRREGGRAEPVVSLLAGAGHGRVISRITGLELASENSLVLEPSVGLWSQAHPHLELGVGGGFRWVSGVEQLSGISDAGLRGWTLSFFVRLQQQR